MTDAIAAIAVFALAASGITAVARALAPQEWLLFKPLSCDLCMSWWSAWGVLGLAAFHHPPASLPDAFLSVCGAVGGALLVTKAANRLG